MRFATAIGFLLLAIMGATATGTTARSEILMPIEAQ